MSGLREVTTPPSTDSHPASTGTRRLGAGSRSARRTPHGCRSLLCGDCDEPIDVVARSVRAGEREARPVRPEADRGHLCGSSVGRGRVGVEHDLTRPECPMAAKESTRPVREGSTAWGGAKAARCYPCLLLSTRTDSARAGAALRLGCRHSGGLVAVRRGRAERQRQERGRGIAVLPAARPDVPS